MEVFWTKTHYAAQGKTIAICREGDKWRFKASWRDAPSEVYATLDACDRAAGRAFNDHINWPGIH